MKNRVVGWIDVGWEIIHALNRGLFKTLDDGKVNRRLVLWFSIYCQYEALKWSLLYANNTLLTDGFTDFVGAAAVIAAILTPVSGLLGAAIKFYNDGRVKELSEPKVD